MTHHKKPSRIAVTLVAVRNFCTIAKAGITDVIAIAALFGVGINLAWCMVHGKEIQELREKVKAQEAQIQQHKTPAFTPQRVARKFDFF